MNLCDTEKCTGCGACDASCPGRCISMQLADNGFKYPVVNSGNCIECGLCEKSCHILHPQTKKPASAIITATYISDDTALNNSSSGGIGYALSEYVLKTGGIVFGAAYDERLNVNIIEVSDTEDLYKLQGSKYVQSDTNNTYPKVKKHLIDGKKVLYFGLPCQIGGLYAYLNNTDTKNLITCDLLCGGGPSPEVLKKYISYLENKYNCKVDNLNFRSKKYGYGYLMHELHFNNGKSRLLYGTDASYIKSLGAGYIRSSCFGCPYASAERIGDLTIGDAWGLKADKDILNKGVSLIMINSAKGESIISKIKDNLIMQERTADDLFKSQHHSIGKEKKKPSNYDSYFKDYVTLDWKSFSDKYLKSKSLKQRILDGVPPALFVKLNNTLRK